MFETLKAFLVIIGWIVYLIGGMGVFVVILVSLWSIAPLNMPIACLHWLPLIYYLIKEDDRKAIADMVKFWSGKPVSEERRQKILEDLEKDLKKTKSV